MRSAPLVARLTHSTAIPADLAACAFLSAFLFSALCPAADSASFPGAEKVTGAGFLERVLAGEGPFEIVVLLEGHLETATGVRADRPDEMRAIQSRVSAREDAALSLVDPADFTPRWRFENFPGFAGTATRRGLEALAGLDSVASIEENLPAWTQLAQGLPLIDAMAARSTFDGAGVAVGIIDTGIDYNHERLGGGGFPNSKVIGGYDVFQNDPDPIDCRFHGTRVAGVVAGEEWAGPGDYIGGVAPNAKLYAIKATQACTGGTNAAAIARGMDWAVTHKYDDPDYPILVLNMSLGGSYLRSNCEGSFPATATAAAAAVANGITLIAASGNSGFCDGLGHPACLGDVISVGAVFDATHAGLAFCVDSRSCARVANGSCSTGWGCNQGSPRADLVTCYSNGASFLDLLAPSNTTYSTDIGGGYTNFAGTSCASPYAAGAAAVLQSSAWYLSKPYYTPAEIRDILITTGEPVTDPKNNITTPRIDLGNAFASMEICDDGQDNDGDGDTDCDDSDCQVDLDGDTLVAVPCGPDCAGNDGGVWDIPGEIRNLAWDDRWIMRWEDLAPQAGTDTTYQMIRGIVAELPVGAGAGESCVNDSIPGPQVLDFTSPQPGDLFYFLVRGVNDCSPSQPEYGRNSAGDPRLSSVCP